jgi:hypothetical protein
MLIMQDMLKLQIELLTHQLSMERGALSQNLQE